MIRIHPRHHPRFASRLAATAMVITALTLGPGKAPAASETAPADTVLASFDGGTVTASEFADIWRKLLPQERPEGDLLKAKRTFLVRMVDRKLLAREALRKPVTLTASEESQLDRARAQMIQNELFMELAADLPKPTAEELDVFARQKSEVAEVRFVSFPDWGMARSWRMRLSTGTPPSALDALLARGGPDAPQADSFRFVDAMEIPDTLATLIWKLRPGQVSEIHSFAGHPVLIQLRTYEPHPAAQLGSNFTLEGEYQRRQYDRLRSGIRTDLATKIGRTFVDEGMNVLLRGYLSIPPRNDVDSITGVPTVRTNLPLPTIALADTGLIIARTIHGELNLITYLRYWGRIAAFTRPDVRERAVLEACVDRVLLEDELIRLAESRQIDRRPSVVNELARMREGFALDHYFAEHIEAKVRVDEPALRRYFAAQPRGHYDDREWLEGRIIVVHRRGLADSVLALARSGASFSELAREYTSDPKFAAKGGKIEKMERGTNRNVGLEEAMFATPIGEIGGPEVTPEGWVVWLIEGKTPAVVRTLDEAREWVERDHRIVEGDRILRELLAGLRKKANARIFDDRVTEDLGSGGDWGD